LIHTQVVVPVVARKKGMGEFYTSADGRQKKKRVSRIPEPVSADLVAIYLRLGERKTMLIMFPRGDALL
jgi:hypothetical protein